MSRSRSVLAVLAATALSSSLLAVPSTAAPTPPEPAHSKPAGVDAAGSTGEGHGPLRDQVALVQVEASASDVAQASDPARIGPAPTTLTATAEPPEDGVTVLGVRWSGPAAADDAVAVMRVKQDSTWGPWQSLGDGLPAGASAGQPNSTDFGTEGAVLIDAQAVQVELTGTVDSATVDLWTSTTTEEDVHRTDALAPVAEGSPALHVATREDWGVDESLRNGSPILHETPKLGVTLHHTAGVPYYSPEEVPAILRGIYHYHAVTLGWGDVGYNLLLDQHGRVWEGRAGGLERNVQGAHAFGMNRDWFGLSVLGNHEIAEVSPEEMTALSASTSWVLDHLDRPVTDEITYTNATEGWTRVLSALHGHGDVGLTLCPGFHLIQRMDELRSRVALEQESDRVAVQRIGGPDRYAVAAGLAQEAALRGAETAYLTQGDSEDVVDALAAGTTAAGKDAAVLLTRQDSLPEDSRSALEALGVDEVVIVGGTAAVSAGVEAQLVELGFVVRRLPGGDRYETTAALSRELPDEPGGTVYLSSGEVLADGLSAAAAAAEAGGPMLLTRSGDLPPVTGERLAELSPTRVVVVGGTGAVGEGVVEEVEALLPAASVDRIGGHNRYATSALLATDAFDTADSTVFAAGTAFVDAMVSTQLAADRRSPVLLVREQCRPTAVNDAVEELGLDLVRLAGGSGVLQDEAASASC